jgi:hypothetical protein
MSAEWVLLNQIRPALREVAEHHERPQPTFLAERFLLAIAGQEADFIHRYQHSPAVTPGPARSVFQFETAGVHGVMTHAASRDMARAACERHRVIWVRDAIWRSLEGHDRLSAIFARLLIWTEPRSLPEGAIDGWNQYLNLWRPGRPRFERWQGMWDAATRAARS